MPSLICELFLPFEVLVILFEGADDRMGVDSLKVFVGWVCDCVGLLAEVNLLQLVLKCGLLGF